MKKLKVFSLLSVLLLSVACSSDYDDDKLWTKVNSLSARVTEIEDQLTQFNRDITTMNALVVAAQNGLSVSSVAETAYGYVITYSDGSHFTLPNTTDGLSPYVGENGTWWIGTTDTGVKAEGKDGESAYIRYGTWWFGNTNTGVSVTATDGQTPRVGTNGNWWIGSVDTGIRATGRDGMTPFIGLNGHWWLGSTDTGVSAYGQVDVEDLTKDIPILTVERYIDGRYYWRQTLNGVKTWLTDSEGRMLPVTGNDAEKPVVRINVEGYWIITIDGGQTWQYILNSSGERVQFYAGCGCKTYFSYVRVVDKWLIIILTDGTVITIRLWGEDDEYNDDDEPGPPYPFNPPYDIIIPNPQPTVDEEYVVRLNLTGMQDPNTKEWLKLYGTGDPMQNAWLQLDGQNKFIRVVNYSEQEGTINVQTDIVFTVDNSGSMSRVSNGIAGDIVAWASSLVSAGLDVKFGCVGYGGRVGAEFGYLVDGYGVTGGMDLGLYSDLNNFLNGRGASGTDRTKGWYGSRAAALQSAASKDLYDKAGGENGAQAIRFANDNFTFRNQANRIYVNFTDDANFSGGSSEISVEYFANQQNWPTNNGTIHSVMSSPESWYHTRASSVSGAELPWLMSDYTGGTTIFVNSDFSGISLNGLPVTSAMVNSYVIYFKIPASMLDGMPHQITVYVRTADGSVRGMRTFNVIFTY